MPLRGVKLLRSEILLRRVLDECVNPTSKNVFTQKNDALPSWGEASFLVFLGVS